MTSLLDRTPTAGRSSNGRGEYRLPVVTRGRRPLVTVASALLVLASIAIFASVYSSADHRVPVLVVTSTIRQGQRITGSDLGTVDVAASGGLSVIPVASASELSGTWAAVTIPAGSLMALSDVTSSRPLAGGSAVVGLALKEGQLPSNGVEPGDQVMIIQTPGVGTVLPVDGAADGSGSEHRHRHRHRAPAPAAAPEPAPSLRAACWWPRPRCSKPPRRPRHRPLE